MTFEDHYTRHKKTSGEVQLYAKVVETTNN